MVHVTKEILIKIISKAMAYLFLQTVENIMAPGKKIKWMVQENSLGKTVPNTKVNIKIILKKEMVYIPSVLIYTTEPGLIIYHMAKACY